MHLIEHLEALFMRYGQQPCGDPSAASVTALAHALQCAQLAEWAYADDALVAAALLHDVGDFAESYDHLGHESRALELLAGGFGADVVEPIRLHVLAKRYLAGTDASYVARLSPESAALLQRQGGAMTDDEARAFEDLPYAADAVALRRWDDLARQPGKQTPPLAYYLTVLESVLERPFVDSKIGIGSLSVA